MAFFMATPNCNFMKSCKIFSAAALLIASMFIFIGCEEVDYTFYSSIKGIIYDSSTGEPAGGASVTLSPSNKTIMTKSDGAYAFEEIDPGQYTILVQKDGYYADRKTVTAITGETANVDIPIKKI